MRFANLGCDFLLQTAEALQLFAGLKADGLAGRNVHFFAGPRIAADAGLPRLHSKNSEAAQFDSLAAAHAVLKRFKNRLDGLFGLDAAHSSSIELGQYGVHDIQFNQTFLTFAGFK